jgi:predicted dehydrogenase
MRTAILGAGRMGRRHVQVVRELGLELVGICDTSPEALALAVTEQGASQDCLFSNAAELLDKTSPECVIIATTAPSHCEYTCMAAQAGAKYILAEKPMACSLADCDRMIEICAGQGTRLAVNHPMRFMDQYVTAKEIVHSAAFGGLSSVTIVGGNFGFAMNGTHYFEMFRYIADEVPVEVTAWFSPGIVANPRGPQYEDRAGSIRAVTATGKRLYMEIGSDQGHGSRITFAGPYGQLVIDDMTGMMYSVIREEAHRALPTTRYGAPAVEKTWVTRPAEVIGPSVAVLKALLSDTDAPSGADGRSAIRVLVGAYQSAENGNIGVRLDSDTLDRDRVFPWA